MFGVILDGFSQSLVLTHTEHGKLGAIHTLQLGPMEIEYGGVKDAMCLFF